MPFTELSAEAACEMLVTAGVRCEAGEVQVEAREDRWVVHLPGGRLAWFASSDDGRRRLSTDRRVLRLLEARCSFSAPRILFEDPAGDFDVRAMVPGVSDPWRIFADARVTLELAAELVVRWV